MSGTNPYIPNSTQLAKIKQVIGDNAESSAYARDRLLDIYSNAKLADGTRLFDNPAVQAQLNRFTTIADNNALVEQTSGKFWTGDGKGANNLFEIIQDIEAVQAADALKGMGEIRMDFALSDSSQIVRRWSIDGKQVTDPQVEKHCDTLLNSWLALDYNVITQNGTLFDANGDGQISFDERKPISVEDVDSIRESLKGDIKGFQSFLRKRDVNIGEVVEQAYPGTEPMEVEVNTVEQNNDVTMDVENDHTQFKQ